MRKLNLLMILALSLALASTALAGGKEKVYGKGISAPDTVRVSDVLADPDAYVGKTIRVTGMAVAVCEHRGCWVSLASDQEGETIRVKVKDGEIVFPPEIKGDLVTAEGVWTANQLTLEQTKAVCAAEARKQGEDYDPDDVETCMTTYQLSGTGAVVASK
ncbi:MAG: DUF4920 domain-containing protein [bacterium]